MATLVIAEKPSLAKAIRAAVGRDYEVTNAFGHVYEQAEPDAYLPASVPDNPKRKGKKIWRIEDLPIIPSEWIKLPKSDAREQIAKIRGLLKSATEVVNAGDPDREGQLLIDEILEELRYKGPVKRVWLQSLTPEAIQEAFGKMRPNSEYKPLSDAAAARSRADWLVGMNLTRAWTVTNGRLISVGRVQTPTLALIVRRDEEIEAFKPKDYFEVWAKVAHANGNFLAKWLPPDTDGPSFDPEGRLIDVARARDVAAKAAGNARIAQYKAEKKQRHAPLPYSLSALQKAASSRLGLGAQAVLDIAQALYEEQLTTYPRTDCQHLAEDQLPGVFAAAEGLASSFGVDIERRKHGAFNDAKVTAHTAIVPTGKDASRLSGDKARVYDMIARACVALFMPPEEYIAASATVDLGAEKWTATGRRVTSPGWTALYGGQADGEDEGEDSTGPTLPAMATGDQAKGLGAEVKSLRTKPPARFTEGTLIDAMSNIHRFITDEAARAKLKETSGIGTEATRAKVIETLFDRQWVSKKGKQLISTPLGRDVIHALPDELTDPVTTARWEDHLGRIAAGQLPPDRFEAAIADFVRQQLSFVKRMDGASAATVPSGPSAPCSVCGKTARRMESRKKKGAYYWACENRDHGLLSDEGGKPGAEFTPKKGYAYFAVETWSELAFLDQPRQC
ncbi:MAG: DNA topoisomerase 3 [Burkholderiales bacterium]|nr:DNA topoisomerase 3 [Burkholderiales bacterium]